MVLPGLENYLAPHQDEVTALLHDATSNNAFFKILNLVDLTALNQSSITKLMQVHTTRTLSKCFICLELQYIIDFLKSLS